MRHLFTKSKKIGSKIISWGLNQDCSHYALQFFEWKGDESLVVESRWPHGIRIVRYKDFLAHNTIVHELWCNTELNDGILFPEVCRRLLGVKYDVAAMAYWFVVRLRQIWFGTPLPKYNRWGSDTHAYCCEILFMLDDELDDFDGTGRDSDMVSPHDCWQLLNGGK